MKPLETIGAIPVVCSPHVYTEYSGFRYDFTTSTLIVPSISAGSVSFSAIQLNGATSGSTTIQAQAIASGTITVPSATDTLVGKATTDTLTNKTFDTAGVGNVLKINGTQVSAVTGSGSVVLATSPTLVTPLLGTPTSGTLTNCTGLPISSGVSGLGTGVATALAVNVGFAGALVVNGGVLGTPSSGTLTSCTGLPISTGVSGLGANVATFLATPTSANLASAVTDETGSGSLVFGTSPTIATPTITTSAVIPLVNGGTTASSTLTLQSTSGAGTSDAIIFRTASQSEKMRITSAGNVGIGATPTYLLDIQKTTGDAIFRSLAGTVDFRSYASQTFNVGYTGTFSNNDFIVMQNSLERMRIASTGINVGSANPTDANFAVFSTGTTYVPLRVQHTASTTNDAPIAMQLARLSSGTPAAGMGCTLQFVLQDAGAAQIGTHQIVSAWSNPAVLNRETSLRINYSKANSNFEALRIDTDGNVLIGYTVSNGAYKLQVNSQIFATNATIATSDRRYKKDIMPIRSGLDVISKLNPVSFTWKEHDIHQFDSGTQVGFIAQDVQDALGGERYSDCVVKRNQVQLKDGSMEEFYGLSDSKLIPLIVKSIQELNAKLEELTGGKGNMISREVL